LPAGVTEPSRPTRPAAAPAVVALFGPTAMGKTEIAVTVAERLGAEIVVADSMQVYRGLPILTNQPAGEQTARVRFHLAGLLDPAVESSVAAYAGLAHAAIDDALARGARVVVEGGSGLYLRAALGHLSFAGRPDAALRGELERRWARDPGDVVAELRALDPATVDQLDVANPRRVVRALEAVLVLKRPLQENERGSLWLPPERYVHHLVALEPERGALRARVDARIDAMLAAGALDEVRRVREEGPLSRTVRQAIGVRECLAVLDGEATPEEAADSMRRRTHALVRRQLTWMRRLPDAAREAVAGRSPEQVAAAVLRRLGQA
jgi:tRNA dimethylallyltransferase